MTSKINTVTVVGAGYMGGGIAQRFAMAQFHTTIVDTDPQASAAALARLYKETAEFEEQGLFPAGSTQRVREYLHAGTDLESAVAGADFIEEAVFERTDLKREVLGTISAAAKPDAIIGTNTSSIPIKAMDTAVTNPERFLTVHFSNPAPFIPGVELVGGEFTDQAVIDTIRDLLPVVGAVGAQIADSPGMVLNRLQYALFAEAASIVQDGVCTPEDLDTIVRTTFGFRLGFFGPFAVADQAGLPIYAAVFEMLHEALGERFAPPEYLTKAVDEGRAGLKNQRGLRGDYAEDDAEAIVAYRNKAYAAMGDLVRQLGPAPSATP